MQRLRNSIKFIKKHSRELTVLCAGLLLYMVTLWQFDMLCAHYMDWTRTIPKIEILPFLYMHQADAYVMFFVGNFIGVVLLILALWFWQEE